MFTVTLFATLAMAAFVPTSAGSASRPRVVALGDSLTSGHGIGTAKAYPAVLQDRLRADGLRVDVVNAGVSGAMSADGLRRLPGALQGDVRVLIVALGANDGLRGVPVAQLKSNVSRIISDAQARGISVLLCAMDALPIYGWDYTVAFHRAYRELAERFRVPLVPFMLQNVIGNDAMMQRDRVHPNAQGAQTIAANIFPYLKPLVEDAVLAK
jgi:acyl-CoA thioesterase-1